MDVRSQLIAAIHDKRLATVAQELLDENDGRRDQAEDSLVRSAVAACENIRATIMLERAAACEQLKRSGIEYDVVDEELVSPQIHKFSLALRQNDPGRAAAVLATLGYRQPGVLNPAQWQVFRRTRNDMVLTRADDVTMRVLLSWRQAVPSGLAAKAWPTIDDAGLIPIGARLWWLAFLVRPFGIALRRLGVVQSGDSLGEFLGTPEELVPLLLNFAAVSADDVVYDLGCGDGRMLIRAAQQFGCRAIGYEHDESLCRLARQKAEQRGVSDLVDIRCADAAEAELDDATLVLLFLPPLQVARMLPALLGQLPRDGRVVAHEQSPFQVDRSPVESQPLFGESALTVAHRWSPEQS